jgi:hypothetical protein
MLMTALNSFVSGFAFGMAISFGSLCWSGTVAFYKWVRK